MTMNDLNQLFFNATRRIDTTKSPTRLLFTFSELKGGSIHKYTLYQPQGI